MLLDLLVLKATGDLHFLFGFLLSAQARIRQTQVVVSFSQGRIARDRAPKEVSRFLVVLSLKRNASHANQPTCVLWVPLEHGLEVSSSAL
jgi:hypothetical protein